MEEEIKRIECLIERCKQCKLNACITCDICWSEVQAIENLMKEFKKAKIENIEYQIGQLPDTTEDYKNLKKELEKWKKI